MSFSTNPKLRVLVDMDMVLCDFEAHLLAEFRRQHPNEPFIPLEEREGFYARDQYSKLKPDGVLADKIRAIQNGQHFFRDLPEVPGACSAVKEMSEMQGVEVYICTSPLTSYEFCLTEKCQWIEQHLGEKWLEKLLIVKDKTLINAHLLIDDRPHVKGAVKKPCWKQVVFTACHNEKSEIGGKKRLQNWTDGTWRELIADFQKQV